MTLVFSAQDLTELIKDKDITSLDTNRFEATYQKAYQFRWNDVDKGSARSVNQRLSI